MKVHVKVRRSRLYSYTYTWITER